ncbi:MAG: ubiquinol-cytochrome C chaperone family protein [Alphaproteobacteria bacterium]|nr:ubiquinol-cytochrome C chaperone family protein [Alphaproteobacteria bacterium]
MFGLFKKKNPYEQAVHEVYAEALENTRKKEFYTEYGVPDTFDGRFDLLLLHIFMILNRMLKDSPVNAESFNQALFDETFKDMDQTLREMGIGDMGVPKHMRKMMKAFNGRMHGYQYAIKENTLSFALKNNLYGTAPETDPAVILKMEQKVLEMEKVLQKQDVSDIMSGKINFE